MPAPLLALVAGTALALFVLPGAPVPGEIPAGLPAPQLPTFTLEAVPGIIQSALVLALLGSIDSLLTSLIADNVTQTYHNSGRELIGQGIGNAIAGAFGAIPGAGVFFMLVVLLLTVFVDLITAVGVGVVLASLLFVKRMSDLQLANIKAIIGETDEHGLSEDEKAALEAGDGRVILYHLSGPFSFGAAKGMARLLAASDDYDGLVLDFREVSFLDSSASFGLEDAIKQALSHDKHVFLVGVRPDVAKILQRLGVLKLPPDTHHHVSRLDALKQAVAMVHA